MASDAEVEDFLEHFGVKGMRWGVRKDEESGGSRELAALDRTAKRESGKIVAQAGAGSDPNYERNRKILIGAGVGLGVAALAAGAYIYTQKGGTIPGLKRSPLGDQADMFTDQFHLGLKNQVTKKLPPLHELDDNDLTLPSTTIFRRVTGMAKEPISDSHMYVSHLQEDADRYVGVFSTAVKNRAGEVHLSELNMKTSVSSPSLKKRVGIMKDMLHEVDRDPKSLTEGMTFREVLIESTAAARGKALGKDSDGLEKYLGGLSDDDLVRETYGTFVNGMGGQINNPQYRVSHVSSYLDKVRSQGYNALVDDANTGVLARSPILLLRPKETIASSSSRRISDADIREARERIKVFGKDAALIRHQETAMDVDDFLAHYGVKGMRWGVRRHTTIISPEKAGGFRERRALKKGKTVITEADKKVAKRKAEDAETLIRINASVSLRDMKIQTDKAAITSAHDAMTSSYIRSGMSAKDAQKKASKVLGYKGINRRLDRQSTRNKKREEKLNDRHKREFGETQ